MLTAIHWPEPTVLNSAINSGFAAAFISTKIFEGLVEYDRNGKPVPQLAESWSVSPDGLSITFHLRGGVKWHDGIDFTSDDVKFSIEVWKRYHSRGRLIYANVTQIDTPDPLTVILRLSHPAPALMSSLNSFTSPVMSRHAYAGTDIPTSPANVNPIGTGPWVFKEWQRGSYIILDRNPNYWQPGRPYPDRLVVRYLPDAAARSAVIETGEVQLGVQTPVALSDVHRLSALPNIGMTTEGYEYFAPIVTMQFNNKRPPFDNILVRKAIAYAMNRDLIIRNVWFGLGKIATGPISSKSEYYTSDVDKYPYDPPKAEALLEQAGYKKDANGVRLKLIYEVSPLGSRISAAWRSSQAAIGPRRHPDRAADTGQRVLVAPALYRLRLQLFHGLCRHLCGSPARGLLVEELSSKACRSRMHPDTTARRWTSVSKRCRSKTIRASACRNSTKSSRSQRATCRYFRCLSWSS